MRHVLRCALLCLVLTGLIVVSPTPTPAVGHASPTASERVSARVSPRHTSRLDQPAAYVATYWRGNPAARVQVAFSTDGVHFTGAVPAGRDELGTQRHNGITYGALRSAEGAVAVRVTADRPLAHVTVLGLSDGAGRTGVRLTDASAAEAATDQPTVVSRAEWGADPDLMTWAPAFYPTRKLIVHHTDTANNYTDQAGAKAQIRAIYEYHSVDQDWGDIGYNFLIDKFGNVYEGRYSREYAGANPSGDNAEGNGVTGAQTEWLELRHRGHRDARDVHVPRCHSGSPRGPRGPAHVGGPTQRPGPPGHRDLRQPGERRDHHYPQHRRAP